MKLSDLKGNIVGTEKYRNDFPEARYFVVPEDFDWRFCKQHINENERRHHIYYLPEEVEKYIQCTAFINDSVFIVFDRSVFRGSAYKFH